ncbi:suppressor of fused domain protein [Pedobacter roseus]|uniref:Suppressor of fused domain protein n=1 Tax=Pedobacter roseus TaxID=336820 RepID=A0A7G9QGY3_9SPHI|nr:suppressor of fused domain protein [Pedobacter roseus]QNN42608.1 suppressor of fused domain protein [Pedobacter roseus]
MTKEEYRQQFTEDDAVGWLAIDKEFERLYPNQEPQHYGTTIKYMLGGEEPLDGLSIYESKRQTDHFHIVSYGFTNLYYDEDLAGEEFSNCGFELTFRLKKINNEKSSDQIWALNLMQNLAKYVFSSNQIFDECHTIDAKGSIRAGYNSNIKALLFVTDPELGIVETPHGQVQFLQIVGLTTKEYEDHKRNQDKNKGIELIDKIRLLNPLFITDLDRI